MSNHTNNHNHERGNHMTGQNNEPARVTNPALVPPKRQPQPVEPKRPERRDRRQRSQREGRARAVPAARVDLSPPLAELLDDMRALVDRLYRAERALSWGLLPLPVAWLCGTTAVLAGADWQAVAAAAVASACAAPVFVAATRHINRVHRDNHTTDGNPAARNNQTTDGNPAARNTEGK